MDVQQVVVVLKIEIERNSFELVISVALTFDFHMEQLNLEHHVLVATVIIIIKQSTVDHVEMDMDIIDEETSIN